MQAMQATDKKFLEKMTIPDIPNDLPESLRNIKDILVVHACAIREVTTKLENLSYELNFSKNRNPIQYISHRIKSPESIIRKMQRRNLPLTYETALREITDIAGIRVVCPYIEDIYAIADMLTRQDDVTVLKTKDYITAPKESGYRSLHLIISVPVFLSNKKQLVNVEVQIRTIAMDFWASLEHQLRYKTPVEIPASIREKLKNSAEVIYNTDLEMQLIYKEISALKEADANP